MTREEVERICKESDIENWTLNSDGTVDVEGDVDISFKKLTKIPLKFRRVSGNFHCSYNKLTGLEGCPSHVEGNFYCGNNKLTSLEGCPSHVEGNFWCNDNKILDFECPSHVGGDINLSGNPVNGVWKLFQNKDDVEFFNDCDPIRGESIVLDRLNFFLEETGKPKVSGVKGYKMI